MNVDRRFVLKGFFSAAVTAAALPSLTKEVFADIESNIALAPLEKVHQSRLLQVIFDHLKLIKENLVDGNTNTPELRAAVRSASERFLDSLSCNQRVIYSWQVMCDDRNNPPEMVSDKEFELAVYVKLTRGLTAYEFIIT